MRSKKRLYMNVHQRGGLRVDFMAC